MWDSLTELERLQVLRGVLHFESFKRENKEKALEIPGNSIDAKTQRHALRRQTALAYFIKRDDLRVRGLLRSIAGLLTRRDEGAVLNKKERALLGRIFAERAQRLLDAESQNENPEGAVPEGEEKKPETPEGPEVFSKEIWEHLYAAGFDCVEMPAKKGKEDAQEFILYVDPTNPNLDPRLNDLFRFDERMTEIQQELKTTGWTPEDHARRNELAGELSRGKTATSWKQAQVMVKMIIKDVFQSIVSREGMTILTKEKLLKVRGRGMDYPTEAQGEAILKKIQPRFPEHSIAIYKQQERHDQNQMMRITRTGEVRTKPLQSENTRPVYDQDTKTKLFPIMLKINMTRGEIETMELNQ